MSVEIDWGVVALALVVLAALRRRLMLALVVVLVPTAIAEWAGASAHSGIESLADILAIPGRAGPAALAALVLLALVPRYLPAWHSVRSTA